MAGRNRRGRGGGELEGTHWGPLGVAPPCISVELIPALLARLLRLPERWLGGQVSPIFGDSRLPPARDHMGLTGSVQGSLDLDPGQDDLSPTSC